MARLLFTVYLILVVTNLTLSQTTGRLTGVIRDKNTQELLFGVSVILEGTNPPIGAATDAEGRFRIENIPTGSYNVKATTWATNHLPNSTSW